MRALVTGGAGFIGSTLVDRLLAEGHDVDVVDDLSSGTLANLAEARRQHRRLRFTQLDVRDPALAELAAQRRPEVVFHLAAQSSVTVSLEQPVLDADVNVLGGVRVLEAARAAGARKVVFAASGGSLYDDDPAELPAREDSPEKLRSPYAVAKRAMLDYFACYFDLYGLDFTALALANVYGPRQHQGAEGGVVAIFVSRLLAGESPPISGDGDQTRDFVFVDDVVDAFSRAATRASGLVLNVGSGTETSIRQLFGTVRHLLGSELEPTHAPERPNEVRRSVLDVSAARTHLGWRPFTGLEEGLLAVIAAAAPTTALRR